MKEEPIDMIEADADDWRRFTHTSDVYIFLHSFYQ